MLATTLLLGFFSMGFGQLSEMIQTWNKVSEVEAYTKPVVVQPKNLEMTEKQQIMSYIVEVFGDDADDAITIINKCENSEFNPKATNWNRNGTWDTGIFQVNQIHGYSMEEMQDWKQNIDVAKKIFDKAGKKWTPWSCAHVVGQKPFYMN